MSAVNNGQNLEYKVKTNDAWTGQGKLYPVFVRKSMNSVCYLTDMSPMDSLEYLMLNPTADITIFPTVLKIHQSVLQYVQSAAMSETVEQNSSDRILTKFSEGADISEEEKLILSFEFTPMALAKSSARYYCCIINTLT